MACEEGIDSRSVAGLRAEMELQRRPRRLQAVRQRRGGLPVRMFHWMVTQVGRMIAEAVFPRRMYGFERCVVYVMTARVRPRGLAQAAAFDNNERLRWKHEDLLGT